MFVRVSLIFSLYMPAYEYVRKSAFGIGYFK